MSDRQKGPIEILCKEIGVRFSREMEHPRILIEFVRVLHARLEHHHWLHAKIDQIARRDVDAADARKALDKLAAVLESNDPAAVASGAAEVHDLLHGFEWRGDWASHVHDIVSSLASALRFGLEPIGGLSSRHAAAAAGHLWKHEYGVSKFDEFTGEWEKSWAAEMFHQTMTRLALRAMKVGADDEVEEQGFSRHREKEPSSVSRREG